jgi:integrase
MPRRRKQDEEKVKGVYEKVPGSGVYWIRFKRNGVTRRERVGAKADAEKLYMIRKVAIYKNEKLPPTQPSRGIRFSEIGQDAINWYEKTRKKDLRTFSGRMRTIIESPMGRKRVADINHRDIAQWIEEQSRARVERKLRRGGKVIVAHIENDWSPATRNRYKTTFSRAFSLAAKAGKTESNPARMVDNMPEDNEVLRYLTAVEEQRLMHAVTQRNKFYLPALLFPLHTGARKSEQFGLTWSNVDLDLQQVTFLNTKRRGLTRYVQLNKTAIKALRSIKRSKTNEYVFQSSRYDDRLRDPKKWFEGALKEAGIHNFTWHNLRHTFISRLVMKGVPLAVVGKIVGHGSEKMTERYAHLCPTTALAAVSMLDPVEAAATASLSQPAL